MLPPLAEVDDLEVWMGVEISGESTSRAVAILAAASTLVRSYTGKVWVDADGETSDATDNPVRFDAVQQVVVLVSERVWKNPNGNTQENTGPFSHTVEAWAALGLALRDEEKAMLGGSSLVPGLGVISTTRGPLETRGTCQGYTESTTTPWYGEV